MNEQLPMGWSEIPPVGDPGDVGTPEDEWATTAHPRNPRKEIRLWVRGERYVRICEVKQLPMKPTAYPFVVHHGKMIDGNEDEIDRSFSHLEPAVIRAKTLMRIGGYE